MFPFVPRGQGLPGWAKKMPPANRSARRSWWAISEPWSQVRVSRAAAGRLASTGSSAWRHRSARLPVGQVHEPQVAAAPVDEGANRGLAHPADDEVALPVPDPLAVFDRERAGVDELGRSEEAHLASVGPPATLTQGSSGAQSAGQRPAQTTFPAVVERLVDRLVADVPSGRLG